MMTPTSSAGSSASVWSSATPAGGGYGGGNRTATLQQLSGFGMRNLALQGTVAGHLLSVYFKLVVDRHVVYVSEVVRHTLNPVWVPFQSEGDLLTDAPETGDGSAPVPNIQHLLCSGTAFEVSVIRVTERRPRRTRRKSRAMSRTAPIVDDDEGWQPANNSRSFADARDPFEDAEAAEEDEPDEPVKDEQPEEEEVLRMAFNVRELEPLPTALADIASLPLNTCLFEFAGRTFVHRDVLDALADSGLSSVKHSRRKGSAIQLKEYSLHEGVDHLERVRAIREKIDARSRSNEQLRTQIQLRLARAQPHISRDQQRAVLEERVRAARQRVGDQRDVLARLRTVMQDERKTFETDIHIPKALLSTMQMSMHYKDEKQGILERRCEVLRAAHKIRSRQAMLVKQLSNVYPIEYVGAGEYKIRGIRIANSDLNGSARADEEMVSTALGYIAHLVFMLSKYLHVNLRYRVVPYSSRSYLKDEINDPLGEYPLYKKGAERDRHEKAVHFLKKDVEQLLFARSLDPTQGAPILARLKTLVDAEVAWLLNERNMAVSAGAIVPR